MGHKQTKEYYKQSRLYNYETSVKTHQENIEELKIKVQNYNVEKDYQDLQNKKTYDHAVAQQDFRHAQELRQFERSNEIADEQISYNRKAADYSKRSLDNVVYERLTKLQFESAGALLKHRVAQQKLRQGERELIQGHNLQTAKAAITAQENLVKTLKKVGTATVKGGRGRSLQKEVNSWWGVSGREQAALQSMLQKSNEQVSTKLYGIHYTMGVEMQKRHLTVKAQEATKDSIIRAYKLGTEEIVNKWEGADMAANHKRLLDPERGVAPIKPDALPRLNDGDSSWRDSFKTHGKFFKRGDVTELDVFEPDAPGLSKEFIAERKTNKSRKLYGKFDKDIGDARMGPILDHRKDHSGAPQGLGGTGARAGSISVGSVTSAVGAGAMAAASIATATATTAASAGIGFGVGSISAAALGPIGMGIAAIGFIGTIFDWW